MIVICNFLTHLLRYEHGNQREMLNKISSMYYLNPLFGILNLFDLFSAARHLTLHVVHRLHLFKRWKPKPKKDIDNELIHNLDKG